VPVVIESLRQLGMSVHDERALPRHWLADRLSTEDQQIEVRAA